MTARLRYPRGLPRVPWEHDHRARPLIPLATTMDPRSAWKGLAFERRYGRNLGDALRGPGANPRAGIDTVADVDPAASPEAVRFQVTGRTVVQDFQVNPELPERLQAFELARFVVPPRAVGVIEKIETFTRLERVTEQGLVTVYEGGPLAGPIPPLGVGLTLGIQRIYALTMECERDPSFVEGGRPVDEVPPASVPEHPYSWFEERYGTSHPLGNQLRLTLPAGVTVRLWAAIAQSVPPLPVTETYLFTLWGSLVGFTIRNGPTRSAYSTATQRGY